MEVIVRNKESRVTNTLALVSKILEADRMEPHTAASLRGIILFMEQQIFGRCGAIAMRTLSGRFLDENVGWKLSALDKKLLEWLPRYFKLAPERVSDSDLAANQSSFVRMALIARSRYDWRNHCRRHVSSNIWLQASWHDGLPVDEVYRASGNSSCMGSEVLVELPAQWTSSVLAHRQ